MRTLTEFTSSKPRIIIVDDELSGLNMLESMLLKWENDVFPFTNGVAALEAAAIVLPDIILLDVSMPEMDGFQVCERIKQNPKIQNIPIIFLSSFNSLDNKLRGFQVGGVDYITKPYRSAEIQARSQRSHQTEQKRFARKSAYSERYIRKWSCGMNQPIKYINKNLKPLQNKEK